MNKNVLFDWPFKIVEISKSWWLTNAKIVYEWEEISIRFKLTNLWKIVEYIRERFWRKWKCYNSITGAYETQPLKQHLKDPDCNLFCR